MTAPFAALQELFIELVMASIPDGTPTRLYCEASYLCIEIAMQPGGDFRRHTLAIFVQGEAINNYSRHNEAQRLAADARLTRFIHKQFAAFFAERDHAQHHDHYFTEWAITDTVLNGLDAPMPGMIVNNSSRYPPSRYTTAPLKRLI